MKILNEVTSSYSVFPTEFDQQTAVVAIDNFLSSFGGQWPPHPDFSQWPASWDPFAVLCDKMPEKLVHLNDPIAFRAWMQVEIQGTVSYDSL